MLKIKHAWHTIDHLNVVQNGEAASLIFTKHSHIMSQKQNICCIISNAFANLYRSSQTVFEEMV